MCRKYLTDISSIWLLKFVEEDFYWSDLRSSCFVGLCRSNRKRTQWKKKSVVEAFIQQKNIKPYYQKKIYEKRCKLKLLRLFCRSMRIETRRIQIDLVPIHFGIHIALVSVNGIVADLRMSFYCLKNCFVFWLLRQPRNESK